MPSLSGVNTTAEPQDFSVLPAGDYKVIVETTETKTSKAGSEYLNMKIKVIDGPAKNRVIFHILNLWSANDTAKRIAESELASIKIAAGYPKEMTLADTAQLHNRPMMAKVIVEIDQQWGDKNKVKSWSPLSNGLPAGGTSKPNTLPTSSGGSSQGVREHESDIPF